MVLVSKIIKKGFYYEYIKIDTIFNQKYFLCLKLFNIFLYIYNTDLKFYHKEILE